MTLTKYQKEVAALDQGEKDNLWYPCLGLAGEVGEVTEPIKKLYRDGRKLDKGHLALELGDVLWYLTCLATRLDMRLEDIAGWNLKKLHQRQKDKEKAEKMI
ncbi:MAG: nucleoside triphosphate pyrophosphohydrolase family protein [Thaumarchaeota archaeon]|nr:nucleoside triphosphate pyrophosphohydrolase family protein [Nitrososphaerota archaeon]